VFVCVYKKESEQERVCMQMCASECKYAFVRVCLCVCIRRGGVRERKGACACAYVCSCVCVCACARACACLMSVSCVFACVMYAMSSVTVFAWSLLKQGILCDS